MCLTVVCVVDELVQVFDTCLNNKISMSNFYKVVTLKRLFGAGAIF